MGKRAAIVSEADVKRMLRAAEKIGHKWVVEVDTTTGKITFRPATDLAPADDGGWRL